MHLERKNAKVMIVCKTNLVKSEYMNHVFTNLVKEKVLHMLRQTYFIVVF